MHRNAIEACARFCGETLGRHAEGRALRSLRPSRKGEKYTPRALTQTHLRRAKNCELLSKESEGFGRGRAGDQGALRRGEGGVSRER